MRNKIKGTREGVPAKFKKDLLFSKHGFVKKIVVILIALMLVAWAVLAFVYSQTSDSASSGDGSQLNDGQNTGWQEYTNPTYRYHFTYPPGYTVRNDPDSPDPDSDVAFINRDLKKEGQASFLFFVMPAASRNGLSLQEWWDMQVAAGNLGVQSYQELDRDRMIGGKEAIVITSKDLGSSSYFFIENDKVILLHGFLVEPYIDQVIESFGIEESGASNFTGTEEMNICNADALCHRGQVVFEGGDVLTITDSEEAVIGIADSTCDEASCYVEDEDGAEWDLVWIRE